MLRASKTLQPENDTRRLNSMSMHADKGWFTRGHDFLKWRGTARNTPTAKMFDRLCAEEHSVGDRMVAFGVNPNLTRVPR
jgi:hypothetical protein